MQELTLEVLSEWGRDHACSMAMVHRVLPFAEELAGFVHREQSDDRYAALLAFARERLSETCATTTTEDANG